MEPDFDPARLAAQLISDHRVHLSQSIAAQLGELVPRYQKLPESDRTRSVSAILRGIERILRGDEHGRLLTVVDEAFDKRASEGFTPVELVLSTHAYLPVLRRVMCERVGDLREGLRAYEEVERLMLPLLRHVFALAFESRDSTDPGFRQRPAAGASWPPSAVMVEPDDDEAPV